MTKQPNTSNNGYKTREEMSKFPIIEVCITFLMFSLIIGLIIVDISDNSKEVKVSCIENNQTYIKTSYRDMGYPLNIEYCGSLDIEDLIAKLKEIK